MSELFKKILIVILFLIIYRFGTYIPLPGINTVVLEEIFKKNSGGMIAMFNMFTGGALGRMSILSLNIMPYITASILIQLLSFSFKEIEEIRKDGIRGRRKITQYTKYLAIILATIQSYGFAVAAENMKLQGTYLVDNPGFLFRFIASLSMIGGTVFVIWLTEQISAIGIGQGSSLLIFTGIVVGIPKSVATLLDMGKNGTISTPFIIMIIIICIGMVFGIILVERGYRKISVMYPKRQVGRQLYASQTSFMPIKINTSGVMAPIFASSLLMFPMTIIGFNESSPEPGSFSYNFIYYFSNGKPLYILTYIFLIFFFSFFYSSAILNPIETAENLKKSNAIVSGQRPGERTAKYISEILNKITTIGAIYLSFICVLPEILVNYYSIPFYLGGTSLLIVVNVIIELFQQFQSYIMGGKYGTMLQQMRKK
ncbi:preprotein translocase subunit SecY [Lyticum sinuosum]|uniref:Protein translocase subunit SecY n=1 Tax=Lyticum sinuosum TaxID=1332059 RepID=A0AAE4VME3_9RICK|nr:preprotein translocase subunit SecY [Lyticum sinuosum]MDZ5761548.1 Protein translocase subunit SecY [Lyticum sinuosum]